MIASKRVPVRKKYLGGIFRFARAPQAFDPEAVAPWRLGEGKRGVLLVHGFAGTPPELRRLGEHLAANGFRCYAPALAGHASTTEEMAKTGFRDWVRTARAGLDELLLSCNSVAVVGQSMGGTIALHLAATDTRVQAVTTLAAPLWLGGPWPIVLPWMRFVFPWHSVTPAPELGSEEAMQSYTWRSNRTVIELFRLMRLVRGELGRICAPVLIIHGGADRTINPRNSYDIARGLRHSQAIKWIIYPRSGHALSVGADATRINQRVLEWLDRHCPATA